ncbi:hypothetical protein Q7C36_009402 [Tachysurus vachellii]|uniref:Uncharacterized protein n=1 Tax=Tachysurus vachellii TaxID=175792 RepID=A0AA88N2I6_TACVA|nr:hypothetical protein Q7C36_009402 [Tachysurus vachellii]
MNRCFLDGYRLIRSPSRLWSELEEGFISTDPCLSITAKTQVKKIKLRLKIKDKTTRTSDWRTGKVEEHDEEEQRSEKGASLSSSSSSPPSLYFKLMLIKEG